VIKNLNDILAIANRFPLKDRRRFIREAAQWCLGYVMATSCKTSGVSALSASQAKETSVKDKDYDFIVVGTGAGGGPLAANLARKGHKVLVFEAGDWASSDRYSIPIMHLYSSVEPEMSWHFFVEHFEKSIENQQSDSKRSSKGIFYPRAATVGGCTAHNALIIVHPENSDWDNMAALVQDPSFKAANMRQYFTRMEKCQYKPRPSLQDSAKHGYDGWLPTDVASPVLLLTDLKVLSIVASAIGQQESKEVLISLLSRLDPNSWAYLNLKEHPGGLFNTPLSMQDGKRRGTREFLRETQELHPERLHIETNAFVTEVLFDTDGKTAIGVKYRSGKSIYSADPRSAPEQTGIDMPPVRIKPGGEVILAGGAFNTPQLLMLSGIGPKEELDKHDIPIRMELSGVGKNLQDRYEVVYITEFKSNFDITKDCTFGLPGDPCLEEWKKDNKHSLYGSNGSVLGMKIKSKKDLEDPDLFIFGVPGHFGGYSYENEGENFTTPIRQTLNHFTWAVLKGHTQNNTGYVRLNSKDPRHTPRINFRNFNDYDLNDTADLDAVIFGVHHVRSIMGGFVKRQFPFIEKIPTTDVLDSPERLRKFVRDECWGHHASCTCAMGPDPQQGAVVDNKFRVHGLKNLRIVDASIFPKIPGLFIVTPIYMISEKASDVIHDAYIRRSQGK
jgi:choline dehydrogenase